jgi:hypothetical protein
MKAMAKHRSYSIEFKRQIAQAYVSGETLHGLAIAPLSDDPLVSMPPLAA